MLKAYDLYYVDGRFTPRSEHYESGDGVVQIAAHSLKQAIRYARYD